MIVALWHSFIFIALGVRLLQCTEGRFVALSIAIGDCATGILLKVLKAEYLLKTEINVTLFILIFRQEIKFF